MKTSTHTHPNATMNRLIQYGALGATIVMLLGALGLLLLPVLGAPVGFGLAGPMLALLALPVLMLTAYTPAVTVSVDGLTLHLAIWRDRSITWADIEAVKPYPLLPSEDEEVTRRFAVGKRNYRPAAGIMLVIPGLPLQYRVMGFFAGVRGRPAIALTNRAHKDYVLLVEKVFRATDPAIHDAELLDESAN